jgi:hypothetical protein
VALKQSSSLFDVVDPHNILPQHSFILNWVLLCDRFSFQSQLKTSKFDRRSMPLRPRFLDSEPAHLLELSFVVINSPEGDADIYFIKRFQLHVSYSGFMTQGWGMFSSFVQKFYFSYNIGFTYYSPLPPTNHSHNLSIQSLSCLYTMTSSPKETMMYFNNTYAHNLTHQGASIITEKFITSIQEMVEYKYKHNTLIIIPQTFIEPIPEAKLYKIIIEFQCNFPKANLCNLSDPIQH